MNERVQRFRRLVAGEGDVGELAAVDRAVRQEDAGAVRADERLVSRFAGLVEARHDLVGVDGRRSRASANMRAIVDLPLAIPPVRPVRRIIAAATPRP